MKAGRKSGLKKAIAKQDKVNNEFMDGLPDSIKENKESVKLFQELLGITNKPKKK